MNLYTPNREALLAKWQHVLDATKHIRTFTTDAELAWIADYATWCSNYLEIGSWRGRSAKVALMANPGLKIFCLDTWDDEGTYEEFLHNLGPEIDAGRVQHSRGSSQEFLEVWFSPTSKKHGATFLDHKLDGCFIDGGHEEHLVRADIEAVRKQMKAGSLMAGHDFAGDNDVARGVLGLYQHIIRPIDSIWAVQL